MPINKPNLVKPAVGGDIDVWGGKLNTNVDAQDIFNNSVANSVNGLDQSVVDLDSNKLEKDGYIGTAKDLNDDKVDKVVGKGLSEEDFTTTLKNKLDNISANAEVNVQSDWNQTNNSQDDFIKNKPRTITQAEIELIDKIGVMTKAEFEARREKWRRDSAGSGFLEWGGSHSTADGVNEGIYCLTTTGNESTLFLGRDSDPVGVSRTKYPVGLIDGSEMKLSSVNTSLGYHQNRILFPQAPDGTKTYDSATGVVTTHADSSTAFASETSTNKVITSRKDHAKIKTTDEGTDHVITTVVFPLGLTQFGEATHDGVTLVDATTLGIDQKLCGFGEWDLSTVGKVGNWSAMTDVQKKRWLSNPENNIRLDPTTGELKQRLAKISVVEAPGNTWENPRLGKYDNNMWLSSSMTQDWSSTQDYSISSSDAGLLEGSSGKAIGLVDIVQRLNLGFYHETYNPDGCRRASDNNKWYNTTVDFNSESDCFDTSKLDTSSGLIAGGTTGRVDQYEYADAVYSGCVKDGRLDANKQDLSKLLEDTTRKAVSGDTRGWGRTIFTNGVVSTSNVVVSDDNAIVVDHSSEIERLFGVPADGTTGDKDLWCNDPDRQVRICNITTGRTIYSSHIYTSNVGKYTFAFSIFGTDRQTTIPSGWMNDGDTIYITYEKFLSSSFDSLPWVDILGNPDRIAATFPDGTIGQWIADLKASGYYDLNRKTINTGYIPFTIFTDNDGSSWGISTTESLDSVNNSVSHTIPSNRIVLDYYESLSDFTEPASNSKVVGKVGDVFAGNDYKVEFANRLNESLTGNISKNNASYPKSGSLNVDSCYIDPVSNKLYSGTQVIPTSHTPFNLGIDNNSKAFKTIYTLTEKDGLLYAQYHWKELFYDSGGASGNEWGDTTPGTTYQTPYGTIPITDNESTMTDLNGNSVKFGTHHTMIPLGINNYNDSSQVT